MNTINRTFILSCAIVCLLASCADPATRQKALSVPAQKEAAEALSAEASTPGSEAEKVYSAAFLNQEVFSITKTVTALEDELTDAKAFGPNIWDYVETYYGDYENQCIRFCVYDSEIEGEIRAALGDPAYLQFTCIEPAAIHAQVLSCGEWNGETGRQSIQMVTSDSNEIFEAGQEISVRVEADAPLALSEGEAVTVLHKISYDATDPPVVYAFSVEGD